MLSNSRSGLTVPKQGLCFLMDNNNNTQRLPGSRKFSNTSVRQGLLSQFKRFVHITETV